MFSIKPQHADVLKQVMKAANGKAGIAAYANAYIEATEHKVTVICGDGSIELSANLIDCDTQQDGIICVDAQKLLQAFTACKFDCTVFIKDGFAEVKSGKAKFKLQSVDHNAYPSYPDTGEQKPVECDAKTLIQQIKSAAFIAPENDVRFFLNGVKIGSFVGASDGFRMVMIATEQTPDAIVPVRAAKSLPDAANAIYVSQNFMTVVTDTLTFKTKLIDGRFPDISRVIGKPEKQAIINVESFNDALRAAQVTTNKTTNGVIIEIGTDGGKVIAKSGGPESSVIEFEAKSDDAIEMGFNSKYLIDAMSYHSGDLAVGFSQNQMIINTDGFANVVMMMRV